MNILILGAGEVGSTLANNLSADHDVTVVDLDESRLLSLQSKLDIRTLQGNSSSPSTLKEAGAQDAELLIAVTSNDESNILACQIAYSLFKVPMKIARVRNKEIANYPELFTQDNIPIDMIINPADLVKDYLECLIQRPGAQLILEFAEGLVEIIGLKIKPHSVLEHQPVSQVYSRLENLPSRLIAVFRNDELLKLDSNSELELLEHDMLLICSQAKDAQETIDRLLESESKCRYMMFAGAGNIGVNLASELENTHQIKLIEQDKFKCEQAAEQLNKAIVLQGDAADSDLLTAENIEEMDLFCALTNDDEVNIMSAIVAKRLGAKSTFALVNRQSYAYHLIERSPDVDMALSPQRITGSQILKCLRKGGITHVHILPWGRAETMELCLEGDSSNSKVIGQALDEIKLPNGVQICSVVRGARVMKLTSDLVLETGDKLILFAVNDQKVPQIEKLFSPKF